MRSVSANQSQHHQSGFSLVELMVAMTIGIVMVGGAFYVYATTRNAYNTNNSYAMMQENARFALSFMEPDVQLAGYLGQHRTASAVENSALNGGSVPGGVGNDCVNLPDDEVGANSWVIQLDRYIDGTDNILSDLDCFTDGRQLVGTDTLVVRRAAPSPTRTANLTAGEIYIRSSESASSKIFTGTVEPLGLPESSLNYALRAHVYYVSGFSAGSSGDNDRVPSLRRIALRNLGGTPTMVDEEVVPGVENLQVQYGYGPAGDQMGPSTVVSYVSDRNNVPANSVVRAVRVWLLLRGERDETGLGYRNEQTYELGNEEILPPDDGFRRLVVSKTIFLRNQF